MAYVGAAYSRNWSYEKGGSDFNAKVGALLTNGADLQTSSTFVQSCQLQDISRRSSCPHRPTGSGDVNANPYKVSGPAEPWIGPRPGFAWVDQHGQPLAIGPPTRDAALLSASGAGSSTAHASAAQTGNSSSNNKHSTQGSTSRSSTYDGLTASHRSMALWEKVSPGMMPDTTKTPAATTAEAYAYEPHLQEAVDFTHHLKRTDFAEYTECKLRHMHHLQAAAKK